MFNLTHQHLVALLILLFMVACSSSNKSTAPSTQQNNQVALPSQPSPETLSNEAPVEHIEIIIVETFPIQVSVIVTGQLSDNCTSLDHITEEFNDHLFTIKITTVRQTHNDCHQEARLFEEIIPLDVEGLKAGIYGVSVNGINDTFELNVDNHILKHSYLLRSS